VLDGKEKSNGDKLKLESCPKDVSDEKRKATFDATYLSMDILN
jgi:hypothetical protein